MEGTDITNLMVLNAFRKCAHIQYFTGKYQGQGRILILLQHREMMTQRELAEVTQRRAATLSEQLETMERAGLIIREKSTDDKRNVDVRLTDKGRQAAVDAEKDRKEIADLLFSGLEQEEKERFYETLLKLSEQWKNINLNIDQSE
ncbi:MAG: MarR family transcriptional regulator [Papillibacter sp.]|jgi:DNA-binding MarR family transcriptional regulator|nr:MarR family transcriptional regulator [Papillibacter sp.]